MSAQKRSLDEMSGNDDSKVASFLLAIIPVSLFSLYGTKRTELFNTLVGPEVRDELRYNYSGANKESRMLVETILNVTGPTTADCKVIVEFARALPDSCLARLHNQHIPTTVEEQNACISTHSSNLFRELQICTCSRAAREYATSKSPFKSIDYQHFCIVQASVHIYLTKPTAQIANSDLLCLLFYSIDYFADRAHIERIMATLIRTICARGRIARNNNKASDRDPHQLLRKARRKSFVAPRSAEQTHEISAELFCHGTMNDAGDSDSDSDGDGNDHAFGKRMTLVVSALDQDIKQDTSLTVDVLSDADSYWVEGQRRDMTSAASLRTQLMDYQCQSVKFMQRIEDAGETGHGVLSHFWLRHTCLGTGREIAYSPFTQKFCRYAMPTHEFAVSGGWLCDDMGLGKTLSMLALIQTRTVLHSESATLIVTPTSLVAQWEAEIRAHVMGSVRVLVYDSKNKAKLGKGTHDIVLVTYRALANEFSAAVVNTKNNNNNNNNNNSAGGLHTFIWHRVVLDEGHCIKNHRTLQARAVAGLRSNRRWILTGTPVDRSLDDLSGQLAFMSSILCKAHTFTKAEMETSVLALDALFRKLVITHNKEQPFNGRRELLHLPDTTHETERVPMSETESADYARIHAAMTRRYELVKYARNKSLHIRTRLLLPLRQAASGAGSVQLPSSSSSSAEDIRASADEDAFNAPGSDECSICLDVMENPVQTPCRHAFCTECIMHALQKRASCPMCRSETSIQALQACSVSSSSSSSSSFATSAAFHSKADRMMQHIRNDRGVSKIIIFSQFKETLTTLRRRMDAANIAYAFLDGGLSVTQRTKMLDKFACLTSTPVMLMSLRAGAVGLTLTMANHVFFMDACMNTALTRQALDRVCRIGQLRETRVTHLLAEGTVEERIWHLFGTNAAKRDTSPLQKQRDMEYLFS